ncbi:MAG: ABC transporter permease [Chloroflexota bacterium]|nr:ABC transporter permease [Chloroflexota bacterium]
MTTESSGDAVVPSANLKITEQRSLLKDAARRFSRNRLAMAGLIIVLSLIFVAIFADFLAPTRYDKAVLSEALQFPSAQHWLGTDAVGRDQLSRIIYGARTSLVVAFSVSIFAVLIGVSLGAAAGLLGGRVDFVVTRMIEIMTAFPSLLFALLILSIFGAGLVNVIMALAIVSWIGLTRLTRAQLFALREKDYVLASRSAGAGNLYIIRRHLLPNAMPALIIMVTLGIPVIIFAEAGLSFLGLGINDPLPSWGKMVGTSSAYIRVYWHLALFPTLMIAITTLGFTFVGDGLRDALDPKMLN